MTDFATPSFRRARTRLIATALLPLALTGLLAAAPARAQEIGPGALMQELIALDTTTTRAPASGAEALFSSPRAAWRAGRQGSATSPVTIPTFPPQAKESSSTLQAVGNGTPSRGVAR